MQRTILLVLGLALAACDPETPDNAVIAEYLNLPDPPHNYNNRDFPNTQIELGRVLFYDRSLSYNKSTSCASCHKQEYAFGDNAAFSRGFGRQLALRNSMPLVDARQNALFWDGRRNTMFEAVMDPIFNHIEMGMDWEKLAARLRETPYYPPLFKSAFGKSYITQDAIATALTGFVSAMKSNSSRFDQYMAGNAKLTSEEIFGAALFESKYQCDACHEGHKGKLASHGYQFIGEFANIGLETIYKDNGLSLITQDRKDEGRFRVPSLSNVALTAPYMHDGSIATLEDVIDHYSNGVASHPNLDAKLKFPDGSPIRLNVTAEEKRALIAFLKTFTDVGVATDPALADPFKER